MPPRLLLQALVSSESLPPAFVSVLSSVDPRLQCGDSATALPAANAKAKRIATSPVKIFIIKFLLSCGAALPMLARPKSHLHNACQKQRSPDDAESVTAPAIL